MFLTVESKVTLSAIILDFFIFATRAIPGDACRIVWCWGLSLGLSHANYVLQPFEASPKSNESEGYLLSGVTRRIKAA